MKGQSKVLGSFSRNILSIYKCMLISFFHGNGSIIHMDAYLSSFIFCFFLKNTLESVLKFLRNIGIVLFLEPKNKVISCYVSKLMT